MGEAADQAALIAEAEARGRTEATVNATLQQHTEHLGAINGSIERGANLQAQLVKGQADLTKGQAELGKALGKLAAGVVTRKQVYGAVTLAAVVTGAIFTASGHV